MKYLLIVSAAAAMAACGKDTTAPGIQCEGEKRAELTAVFGAQYEPSENLLLNNRWTAGSRTWDWNVSNCTVTRSP